MQLRFGVTIAVCAIIAACGGQSVETPADPEAKLVDSQSETLEQVGPELEKIPAIAEELETVEPVTITIETEQITASANIDGAIMSFAPSLGERIKTETETAFTKAQNAAMEEADFEYFTAHDYQYDFIKSASVGDVISVEYFNMFFTGGAHPNYFLGGIIHDRSTGEDVMARDMLSEDGKAAMKVLLMEELAKQKVKRMSMLAEDLPILREEVAEVFPKDIEFWFGEVTLVPSTVDQKFGGLVVHYSPYDVGAYAEGSYDILVSASDASPMLTAKYAGMFGGDPVYDEAEEY